MYNLARSLFCVAFLFPGLSCATLVDFSTNNFSDLSYSASWEDTQGVEFTFSSSHLPFTSKGDEIDRINDREKDSSGNTIYTDTDTRLTFGFSTYITELRIYVEDIDQDTDRFANFSYFPLFVDGGLELFPDNTVTGKTDGGGLLYDGGNGNIYWSGIYTNFISFDWQRATNMGINIKEVEYKITEPSPFWLLFASLFVIRFFRNRVSEKFL